MAELLPLAFEGRILKKGGCWLWLGAKTKRGYGHLSLAGTHMLAHRFSYRWFKAEIPEGMHVCHSCDNPSCVNPKHLWVGTAKQNMADCKRKGRNIPSAHRKLTAEQVRWIRANRHIRKIDQAKKFGVSIGTIKDARSGRSYKEVKP